MQIFMYIVCMGSMLAAMENAQKPSPQKQFIDDCKTALGKDDFDINAVDQHGLTLLHYASSSGYPKAVIWLVTHGADINLQNSVSRNTTALSCAVQNGHFHTATILLRASADPLLPDADGNTPLLQALEVDPAHISCSLLTLLINYGALYNQTLTNEQIRLLKKRLLSPLADVVLFGGTTSCELNVTQIIILVAANNKNLIPAITKLKELGVPIDNAIKGAIERIDIILKRTSLQLKDKTSYEEIKRILESYLSKKRTAKIQDNRQPDRASTRAINYVRPNPAFERNLSIGISLGGLAIIALAYAFAEVTRL